MSEVQGKIIGISRDSTKVPTPATPLCEDGQEARSATLRVSNGGVGHSPGFVGGFLKNVSCKGCLFEG